MRIARMLLRLGQAMLLVAIVAGSVAAARQVASELRKPSDRPRLSQVPG
jgi:hypothetical protein